MSDTLPELVADRYRLIEPLGQGGMGRVWKARDEVLHRDVAIKELVPPAGLTDDERREMRERSLREARAIARLNHANVVRVFDVLRTNGDPWIVMEYVPSRSLQDQINQDGPVSVTRAAQIGLGVLGALRAAHRNGVLHRDVKPGNVLLAEDGRVVLTDFGLATVPGDPTVTRTGLVLGSPAYIAPERARDGAASPEGDLWSLGATIYAAVEGQSPFGRTSAMATLAALATEPVPPMRNAGPLKSALNGLLQKDPAQRISADDAERLFLRVSQRRSRPGLSLFGAGRRPGPDGGPRERRPAVLPAPRSPQPGSVGPAVGGVAAAAAAGAASGTASPAMAPAAVDAAALTDQQSTGTPEAPGASESSRGEPPTTVLAAPAPAAPVPAGQASPPVAAEAPVDQERGHPSPQTDGHRPSGPPPVGTRPPGTPYDGNAPARRRRNLILLGVAALLVLAIVVAVPLIDRDSGDDPAGRQAGATPTPAAQTAGQGGEPTASPTQAGSPSQPAAPPATSQPPPAANEPPAQPAQPGDPVVPVGWRLHDDPSGFAVPVPNGWREDRSEFRNGRVYFRDPNSQRMLLIDQTRTPKPDPVADWREQERYRRDDINGYERVGDIREVDYWDKAADWEWLETRGGVRIHVRNRGFVTAPDQAYAIRWDAPADQWEANLPNFEIIAEGFRPARS